MMPDRKFLSDFSSTSTAHLACASRINFHHCDTGAFSLVSQDRQETAPGSIRDCSTEPAVPEHPCDVQVFHCDQSMATDQIQCGFMMVISTFVCDFSIKGANDFDRLAPIRPAFLLTADSSLSPTQGREFFLEIARIFNDITIRGGEEVLDPDINTHGREFVGFNGYIAEITGEDDIPSVVLALERCGLNSALYGTMDFAANFANVLNAKSVIPESDAVAISGELNTVEPVPVLKAWITRFPSRFDTAVESLKCPAELPHGGLCRGEVEALVVGIGFSLVLEPGRLLVIVYADTVIFIGGFTLFKTGVVEPSVSLEHDAEFALLINIGEETELESFAHDLLALLAFYVFAYRRVGHAAYRGNEVTPAPKCRQTGTQTCKLVSKDMRGISLEPLGYFRRAPARVSLYEQVNMLGHNLQSVNRHLNLDSLFSKEGFQPAGDLSFKHRTSILRTPHEVVLEAENSSGVFSVSSIHINNIYPTDTKSTLIGKEIRSFPCQLKQTVPAA